MTALNDVAFVARTSSAAHAASSFSIRSAVSTGPTPSITPAAAHVASITRKSSNAARRCTVLIAAISGGSVMRVVWTSYPSRSNRRFARASSARACPI